MWRASGGTCPSTLSSARPTRWRCGPKCGRGGRGARCLRRASRTRRARRCCSARPHLSPARTSSVPCSPRPWCRALGSCFQRLAVAVAVAAADPVEAAAVEAAEGMAAEAVGGARRTPAAAASVFRLLLAGRSMCWPLRAARRISSLNSAPRTHVGRTARTHSRVATRWASWRFAGRATWAKPDGYRRSRSSAPPALAKTSSFL
mmetsp:Transcript_2208/g.5190  ORF Transcript_2208/g.5190 Transcript_2208/m.5190 type:complete len:204 (+) Transcript_2208:637-1248(+)